MRLLCTMFAAAFAAALLALPAHAGDERPFPRRAGAAKARPDARAFRAQRGARGHRARALPMRRGQRFAGHRHARTPLGLRAAPGRGGHRAAAALAAFRRMDRNHDGVIDRREFVLFARQRDGEQGPRSARRGLTRGGPGAWARPGRGAHRSLEARGSGKDRRRFATRGRGAGPARQGLDRRRTRARGAAIRYRLQQADRDGDGKLSRAEAPEALGPHFAALDRDRDGHLDRTELRAAVRRLTGGRQGRAEKRARGSRGRGKKD